MPIAEVNGQRIHYTDTGGDGPPVLWSHGFLMDHTMFDAQIAALGDRSRSIAWDERGFGATPATEAFTYWDSAADAVALLDHLGIDQAVFAGMSQGGFLSLRAALAHPDRVRGLVLIDTQAGVDPPEVLDGYRGMMDHWLSDEPLEPVAEIVAGLILGRDDLSAHWMSVWQDRRAEMTAEAGACLFDRDDITDRMGEITAPALVIHGDADTAIDIELGRALAEALPDARFVEIPGATHAANLTHPELVDAAITAFLDELG
jgi:pimeloyl-ACP methyl ester carboxylesterase